MKAKLSKTLGLAFGFGAVMLFVGAPKISADLITLTDSNSTAVFDPDASGGTAGQTSWVVDGVNQLAQQAFWYRVGSSGPEINLATLPVVNSSTANTILSTYTAAGQFQVILDFQLNGGSPGTHQSGLLEAIEVDNLSGSPLPFHFFQYTNFRLANALGQDSVSFPFGNEVTQVDLPGNAISDTVLTPFPDHHEGALFNATLLSLTDANPTTLSDLPAFGSSSVGPGNVSWAYQWDRDFDVGDSLIISELKGLDYLAVPEPSIIFMMGLGLGALVVVSKRAASRIRK